MTDYVLEVLSYRGIVAWAVHYRGVVKGPYPQPCHDGGTTMTRGKTICSRCGTELPPRVEWDVEEPWTEGRYERYAAAAFEGGSPSHFLDKRTLINAAIGRFAGYYLPGWWEDKPVIGEPGDRLFYVWEPWQVLPESFTDKERRRADGLPLPGDLLLEIPVTGARKERRDGAKAA